MMRQQSSKDRPDRGERPFNPFNGYRIGAFVLLIASGVLLSFIGKQHTLVFENMEYTGGGKLYSAFETARVTLSNGVEVEIEEDDYDEARFVGPFCTLRVETESGGVKTVTEKKLYLGFTDYFEFNLPEFVHGAEG